MTDYWLSKMVYDMVHDPVLAASYRADRTKVMDAYQINREVRKALLDDDIAAIQPLLNAYLLRFYFQIRGMPEEEFVSRLHALNRKDISHG